MLHLDDTELYDLPEAGRRLLADPARLARWIRQGRIPGVRRRSGWALPRAWVDAETGAVAADAEAVRRYWLERLAPPPPTARRPARDRAHLPASDLVAAEEAARGVYADVERLARLERERVLPALRVDGRTLYDGDLVRLLGRDLPVPPDDEAASRRRHDVETWTRYEYVTDLDAGAAPPDTETAAAPASTTAVAPGAWRLPEDLPDLDALPAPAGEPGPSPAPSRLIEAEGFETEEEP